MLLSSINITNLDFDVTFCNLYGRDCSFIVCTLVTLYHFCKFLIRAGFDVEIIQYAYQLGDGAKKYYRLEDNYRSTIYKCKKTEYNANN